MFDLTDAIEKQQIPWNVVQCLLYSAASQPLRPTLNEYIKEYCPDLDELKTTYKEHDDVIFYKLMVDERTKRPALIVHPGALDAVCKALRINDIPASSYVKQQNAADDASSGMMSPSHSSQLRETITLIVSRVQKKLREVTKRAEKPRQILYCGQKMFTFSGDLVGEMFAAEKELESLLIIQKVLLDD